MVIKHSFLRSKVHPQKPSWQSIYVGLGILVHTIIMIIIIIIIIIIKTFFIIKIYTIIRKNKCNYMYI